MNRRVVAGRLVVAGTTLALVLAGVLVVLPGRERRLDALVGTALAQAVNRDTVEVSTSDRGPGTGPVAGAVTYLVVGSDRREGLVRRQPASGRLLGEQADVIMLWSVLAGQQTRVLSLPRDLRVDVAGRGARKLGATLGYGRGPLVEAVRTLTGLPVHHYVVVDFTGFADAVDAVGGVPLTLRHPIRDRVTGLRLPAGPVVLDGTTALRFVRSRQAQELRSGRWRPVAGDLARIRRQQRVVLALVERVRSSAGPLTLVRLQRAGARGVTVDRAFTGRDAARLVALPGSRSGTSLSTCTLPSRRQVPDALGASPFAPQHDGSTVFRVVDPVGAAAVLTWFAGDPRVAPAACDPGE